LETENTVLVAEDQQLVQTILKIKFWRNRMTVNAGYVNNTKVLLTTNLRIPHFGEE
jgi:hypothetical protein